MTQMETIYQVIRMINIGDTEWRDIVWRGIGNQGLFELSATYPKYWSWDEIYDHLPGIDYYSLNRKQKHAVLSGQASIRYFFQARQPHRRYHSIKDPRILECCVPRSIFIKHCFREQRPHDHDNQPAITVGRRVDFLDDVVLNGMYVQYAYPAMPT